MCLPELIRGSLPAWGMMFQPSLRVTLALPLERKEQLVLTFTTHINFPMTMYMTCIMGLSRLIWTPLKLVPTIGQPHERKSVTPKDISGVHSCISKCFHEYASAAPRSVRNLHSLHTLYNVYGN